MQYLQVARFSFPIVNLFTGAGTLIFVRERANEVVSSGMVVVTSARSYRPDSQLRTSVCRYGFRMRHVLGPARPPPSSCHAAIRALVYAHVT